MSYFMELSFLIYQMIYELEMSGFIMRMGGIIGMIHWTELGGIVGETKMIWLRKKSGNFMVSFSLQ